MQFREQLAIRSSLPSIERSFVVHIPNSFNIPVALQQGYIDIVFDCDTHDFYIVDNKVDCRGSAYTTTHGRIYKGHPTLALAYYIQHSKALGVIIPTYITRYYNSDFKHIQDINTKIPIVKLIEYAQEMYAIYNELDWSLINQSNLPLYSDFIYNLQCIEKSGLKVDQDLFREHFERYPYKGDFTYTKYNPYTATGRPSNAYNNINYAALPKEDSTRNTFISRFDQGKLLEVDFKSYHIHLIANLIQYKFEHEDIHTYFGKFYFGTENLTEAQYEESKTRTFKSLYSSNRPDHPFFNEIRALTEILYEEYKNTGCLLTPIFNRKITSISEPNINKVFNYFIQCYETERNASVIQKILTLLEQQESKIILYTYDSILIDFNLLDGRSLLNELLSILTQDSYPFTLKVGDNYGSMKTINL